MEVCALFGLHDPKASVVLCYLPVLDQHIQQLCAEYMRQAVLSEEVLKHIHFY